MKKILKIKLWTGVLPCLLFCGNFFWCSVLFAEEKGSFLFRHLLETAASSSQASSGGPETMGSLLSSIRLASSLTSGSSEIFRDQKKSNETAVNSKLRYTFRFTEYFFTSVLFTTGSKVHYERESLGNKGTILQDNSQTSQNQFGWKIGVGPMNYLSDFSFEFSMGVERLKQSGPFFTSGYRFPRIESGRIVSGDYLLGEGNFDFTTNAYSLNYGISFTGDLLGMYMYMETQYIYGKSKLNSISLFPNSSLSNPTNFFLGNSDTQIAALRINSIKGAMVLMELGFIIKFTESIGVKFGGYYQATNFLLDNPSGYYYENGKWNEASSSTKFISAQTRNSLGFYGATFGVVTRF